MNVYNIDSKLLLSRTIECEKGLNEVKLESTELNANGVLYYEIEIGIYKELRRMIIIE